MVSFPAKTRGGKLIAFSRLQICSPTHLRKHSATDGTKLDLNIGGFPGFGGLIKRAKSTTLQSYAIYLFLQVTDVQENGISLPLFSYGRDKLINLFFGTGLHTWVVVSNIFYFHPYLGKVPILTNIFQRGWNYQLDTHFGFLFWGKLLTPWQPTQPQPDRGKPWRFKRMIRRHEVPKSRGSSKFRRLIDLTVQTKTGKPTMNEDGFSYWKWRIFQCYGSFPGWYVNRWHVVDFRKGRSTPTISIWRLTQKYGDFTPQNGWVFKKGNPNPMNKWDDLGVPFLETPIGP